MTTYPAAAYTAADASTAARAAAERAVHAAWAAFAPVARGVARGRADAAATHAARARYHAARTDAALADALAACAAVWPMLAVVLAVMARPYYVAHVAAYRATLAARSAAHHVAARDALRDAHATAALAAMRRAWAVQGVPIYARGTLPVERAAGVPAAYVMSHAGRVASALAAFSTADHERGTADAITTGGQRIYTRPDLRPTYGPALPITASTPDYVRPTAVADADWPWRVVLPDDALAVWEVMAARAADVRAVMPRPLAAGYASPTWQCLPGTPGITRPSADAPRPWANRVRLVWRFVGQYRRLGSLIRTGRTRRVRTGPADVMAVHALLGAWQNVPGRVVAAMAADPSRPVLWNATAERAADAWMVAHGDVWHGPNGEPRGPIFQRPDVWDTRSRRLHVRPDRVAFRGVSRDLSVTDGVTGRTRRVWRGARVRYETAVRPNGDANGRNATPYRETADGQRVWMLRTYGYVTDAWARVFVGHTAVGMVARNGRTGRRARAVARAAAGTTGKRGPARSAWALSARGVRGVLARTGRADVAAVLHAVAVGVDGVAATGGRITLACADGTHVVFGGDGHVALPDGRRYTLGDYARRAAAAGVWPVATSGHAWPTPGQ